MCRVSATAGILLAAVACVAGAAVDPGKATAPRMEFVPPPPGSYKLQRIQRVSDAVLLDSAGHPVSLSALTHGKITLLTFFYTYCVDPLGCPFAHTTLAQLRDRVSGDGALAGRVRFDAGPLAGCRYAGAAGPSGAGRPSASASEPAAARST